jgi:asparagine synthase (glutamine-hydrolysing)
MPILGFVGAPDRRLDASFAAVFHSLTRDPFVADSLCERSWGIGRVHLGVFDRSAQLASHDRIHAVVIGELELPVPCDSPEMPSQAAAVVALYRSRGASGLSRLRGAFAVALIDTQRRSVALVCDRFGSHPLYWSADGDGFYFASSLRALLRLRKRRPHLDPCAMADYLTLGFVTGRRTLDADAQLVEPGSVLAWRHDGGVTTDVDAPTQALFQRREQSYTTYVSSVVDAFGAATARMSRESDTVGMSISGGLDSRAILSAIANKENFPTYTLGVPGCADEVIARRLCALTGARFTPVALDQAYLTGFLDHFQRMVGMTDGMYLSHGLTEMLALDVLQQAPFRILLRGHCGELAKTSLAWPLHTEPRVFELRTSAELVDHLLRRYRQISGGVDWIDAFREPWRSAMAGTVSVSLEQSVKDVDLSPAELCSYLYLREHQRRFTVPSLEIFRTAVEVRLPFLDEPFIRALFSGPPEWRHSTDIHREILARFDQRLLWVRDSNTGAPVNAGPIARRVAAKVDGLFRRLDVWGYRHYHQFDRWMSHLLVESFEAQLLSPRCLDRGMLLPEGVRALIDGARSGRSGYAYLLQVLLILELWQQQNVDVHDGEPLAPETAAAPVTVS